MQEFFLSYNTTIIQNTNPYKLGIEKLKENEVGITVEKDIHKSADTGKHILGLPISF